MPLIAVAEVGHSSLLGFEFELNAPHTLCRVCGALFQSNYDRHPGNYVDDHYFLSTDMVALYALSLRKQWSRDHAATHPNWQHGALAESQRWLTPEAAERLAPFGIIDLAGLALDEEVAAAYKQAPRTPTDDAEGVAHRHG